MGRAERRREEKRQAHEARMAAASAEAAVMKSYMKSGTYDAPRALKDNAYMNAIKNHRAKLEERWAQNGITREDMKKEYERGYEDATRDIERRTSEFYFAAMCIVLHRDFKFGKTRLCNAMQNLYNVMVSELTNEDIRVRCKRETGVDICLNELEDGFEIDF